MVSFDSFVMEDGIPIYMQIVLHIKRGVVAGIITDGDELPSRRSLSALLAINPNTVQKAYRILEDEELIESQVGAKSIVVLDRTKIATLDDELLGDGMKRIVSELKAMGLSRQASVDLLEKYWEE